MHAIIYKKKPDTDRARHPFARSAHVPYSLARLRRSFTVLAAVELLLERRHLRLVRYEPRAKRRGRHYCDQSHEHEVSPLGLLRVLDSSRWLASSPSRRRPRGGGAHEPSKLLLLLLLWLEFSPSLQNPMAVRLRRCLDEQETSSQGGHRKKKIHQDPSSVPLVSSPLLLFCRRCSYSRRTRADLLLLAAVQFVRSWISSHFEFIINRESGKPSFFLGNQD